VFSPGKTYRDLQILCELEVYIAYSFKISLAVHVYSSDRLLREKKMVKRSKTSCKWRTTIIIIIITITIIIKSPWNINGSFDQEILQLVCNLNVQCSVCTSATGLCPDGVQNITLRKNSFNIITVVIPRKARHSKPSTPFLLFHINSITFRLSLSQCCHPCQKKIFLSQKRDFFSR